MRLIRYGVHSKTHDLEPSVVTIGNFDGVHLGHQYVIQSVKKYAKEHHFLATVVTFEPTPSEYFLREKAPKRLTQFREKTERLQDLFIDILCVLRFNFEMASLSPEDFIQKILVSGLNMQHIVVGDDFKFGKNRAGNIPLLQQAGSHFGFGVTVMPAFLYEGVRVSSTRIREALMEGKISVAEHLLGRKVNA